MSPPQPIRATGTVGTEPWVVTLSRQVHH